VYVPDGPEYKKLQEKYDRDGDKQVREPNTKEDPFMARVGNFA
jgi:hypothetical protein